MIQSVIPERNLQSTIVVQELIVDNTSFDGVTQGRLLVCFQSSNRIL